MDQPEIQAFYHISATQLADTSAHFRVFLFCFQKSANQMRNPFQPAAAVPDHQQPWRQNQSYIGLCHYALHQQQYCQCFKRKSHRPEKRTGTFSSKFRTYKPDTAYHRTSQKYLRLGYLRHRKPLVSQ